MSLKTEAQLIQELAEVWGMLDAERAGRAAAVLAMRERCAGACEDEARLWEVDGKGPATEARLCAARIRALGPNT